MASLLPAASERGKPKPLDRVRQLMRLRHYSLRTEAAYVGWKRRYILFHGKRHPRELEEEDVSKFLSSLAIEGRDVSTTMVTRTFESTRPECEEPARSCLTFRVTHVRCPGPSPLLDVAQVTIRSMIRTVLLLTNVTCAVLVCAADAQVNVEQIVAQKVQPILPKGEGGGVAVAVSVGGKTSFFNYGMADNAQNRPVTADSIFNLGSVGKVFATTLLAQAVKNGEMSLSDPVAKYVTELQKGGDIRRVTVGELASHTSGLPRVPQQYETWHRGRYTWPDFVRFLNSWKAGPNHEPGQQYLYSNAAMVLLRVALERRFNTRFAELMHLRLTGPLGMSSTALPLPQNLLGRAVQGYGPNGRPIGRPGMEGGTFQWPGSGQIYSSSRDMATFLAANLGELPGHQPIETAMALAQQPVFTVGPRLKLGLAWQNVTAGNVTIIDKNGGLQNTSTYIGFAPKRKLGVMILVNRGNQHATVIGRQIIHALAQDQSQPSTEGELNPDSD